MPTDEAPDRAVVPFGSWRSPITAELIVQASVGLGGPVCSAGDLWWSELRPTEGGRVQIVRKPLAGAPESARGVLPDGFSARTRVHEYGGGAWWLHDDTLFFTNWVDQRVYRLDHAGSGDDHDPVAITPLPGDPAAFRYADGRVTADGGWIVCVREWHGAPGDDDVRNEIVAIPSDGSHEPTILVGGVRGPDFVSNPRFDRTGDRLCWLQWNHPDMPWDATELWVADFDPGSHIATPTLTDRRRVAGGPGISVAQPAIVGDELWFVVDSVVGPSGAPADESGTADESATFAGVAGVAGVGAAGAEVAAVGGADADATVPTVGPVGGYWNLAAALWAKSPPGVRAPDTSDRDGMDGMDGIGGISATANRQITSEHAELGQPQWVFGQSDWTVTGEGEVVVRGRFDGVDHLGLVRKADQGQEPIGPDATCLPVRWLDVPFTSIDGITAIGDSSVGFVGASFVGEPVVASIDLATGPDATQGKSDAAVALTVHRPARELGLGAEWFSVPDHIEFPTSAGSDRLPATAHALFYAPTNPGHGGPEGAAPPLIVMSHGGPTSAARPQLNLAVQFWTSRGFGVVDVNYRGSTGYGRAYRDALRGQWGIADVDDCIAAARHLASEGRVDGERLAIRGGSAGGYTTLCALTFHDDFTAGCSLYGVADLAALATDTHKFESRYLDRLIGPYPERRDLYEERSPIHHTEQLATPLILLQGLEDEIVPPSQAEMMVAALEARGVPHAYVAFEGEQHGFRQAANIRRALEAELYFYARVFGFDLVDDIEPVPIRFL